VSDAHLWHPWLRINRVLRVMLQTRLSAEAWPEVGAEFMKAIALRSQIWRRGGAAVDRMAMVGHKPEAI
jgi:hypothetical protein